MEPFLIRVSQDIDSKDGGESFHSAANPLPSMLEILASDGINARQVGTTYATLDKQPAPSQ